VAAFELLRGIDWAAVAKLIEDGVKAKKKDTAWSSYGELWEKVGQWKDIFLDRATAPYTNDAQRQEIRTTLQRRLQQIQESMKSLRRAIEKGDQDMAQAQLKNIQGLIEQLKTWLAANPPQPQ
jgi:ribosomal protein S20